VTPIYGELLRVFLPETALVVGALLVLTVDLIGGRGQSVARRMRVAATIALVALGAALVGAVLAGKGGPVFGGVLTLDALTTVARIGVLALALLTVALAADVVRLPNPAEYIAVILFATVGFTLMAAANQLLLAFLALELASLSLYVLAGFDKSRPESAEAALKYFLFGGVSAAFLLFGFSLIYGLTGSIELPEISRQIGTQPPSTLLMVALVMILVAFGFKAAAAPFHLWAPDVYEGAPPSSAALIASASKLAGFVLLIRLFWGGFGGAPGGNVLPSWLPVVAILSGASLVLGNIAALAQSNVRRLLAYSAIAHAGVLLLGVMVAGRTGPGPLVYYALTYGIATVGAFGVIAVLDRSGSGRSFADFAGLHRRSPLLAGCLGVFVLSLAGIPPLAGFFGKFLVFAEALKSGGLNHTPGWLAFLAIAASAVALYYYLLILKQAFVAKAAPDSARITVPATASAALLAAALALVALGLAPGLVLGSF
jgi:NADH-quinone oxidoreductase subunit N